PVDQVADADQGDADGDARHHQVGHPAVGHTLADAVVPAGQEAAADGAVEGQAAVVHPQDFAGVGGVVRPVGGHVYNAGTDYPGDDDDQAEVVQVLLGNALAASVGNHHIKARRHGDGHQEAVP